RAFWVVRRDAHQVDTAPVPSVSTPGAFTIALVFPPGWSQFGNPFEFPVRWDATQRSSGLGTPVAFDPALGDYTDQKPDVLDPFEGYFIENTATTPETLYIPPIAAGEPAPPIVPARAGDPPSV